MNRDDERNQAPRANPDSPEPDEADLPPDIRRLRELAERLSYASNLSIEERAQLMQEVTEELLIQKRLVKEALLRGETVDAESRFEVSIDASGDVIIAEKSENDPG